MSERTFIFRGWNTKRTNVFDGTITYRYTIGYTDNPEPKVILEYTHGQAVPMSAKVHRSVLKDERVSKNLASILKRKVILPIAKDGVEWYELQDRV
nr:MAG TPA: hypothetical protein [Caudoviricetes sp.]